VVDADHVAAVEMIEDLRGRIEILMDEIEISLGMEPRRSPVMTILIWSSARDRRGHGTSRAQRLIDPPSGVTYCCAFHCLQDGEHTNKL
jgi:hypothetical protein